MTVKRLGRKPRLTLIEALVWCVILAIALFRAVALAHGAPLAVHPPDLHTATVENALLLSEGWRAASDPNAFDPTSLTSSSNLLITTSPQGLGAPSAFARSVTYEFVAEAVSYSAARVQSP